jgi:hypothetical protein
MKYYYQRDIYIKNMFNDLTGSFEFCNTKYECEV